MGSFSDPGKDVQSMLMTESDVVVCQVKDRAGHVERDLQFYNPFIASLVTSFGRHAITQQLRRAGPDAFYCSSLLLTLLSLISLYVFLAR